MSRLLLGPSTRSTTVWIAFDSMDGGCTSVGPFGLSLMDVRSPHAVLASTACGDLTSINDNPKDRKSTRLNSSHANISYAVFCLKKKKNKKKNTTQRRYDNI